MLEIILKKAGHRAKKTVQIMAGIKPDSKFEKKTLFSAHLVALMPRNSSILSTLTKLVAKLNKTS
jgi:hypothetical protein